MKQGVDYIGVTVVFFCHDGKGNILLNKRSNKCRDEKGRWDCGGGAIKFGESFEQAVRREIKEEYRTGVKKLQFLYVRNMLRIDDKIKTHWIGIVFAALVDPKKVKIGVPKKIDQIGWFKLSNLPKPLHSMFLTHLEFVKKAGII